MAMARATSTSTAGPRSFQSRGAPFAGLSLTGAVAVSRRLMMRTPLDRGLRLAGWQHPATQRADQIHPQFAFASLRPDDELLLRQHLALGRQHLQVAGQPAAVARQRKVVGMLRQAQRLVLLAALFGEPAQRNQLVD